MKNSAEFAWPACVSGTMGNNLYRREGWQSWGVVAPLVTWLRILGKSGTDPQFSNIDSIPSRKMESLATQNIIHQEEDIKEDLYVIPSFLLTREKYVKRTVVLFTI